MKNPHTELKNAALIALSSTELGRFWPCETGVAIAAHWNGAIWAPEIPTRVIKYGLVGGSDIMGILKGGFFFAGEVKTGKAVLNQGQRNFKAMILKYGGCHIEIRSIEQALNELMEYFKCKK